MFELPEIDIGSVVGADNLMVYLMKGAALPAQNGFFFVLILVSLLGLVEYFVSKKTALQGIVQKMSPVQGIAGVILAIYAIVALIMSFTILGKSFLLFLAFFIASLTALALSAILGARFIFSFFSKNDKAVQVATKIANTGNSILFTLCWINLSAGFFMFLTMCGLAAAFR